VDTKFFPRNATWTVIVAAGCTNCYTSHVLFGSLLCDVATLNLVSHSKGRMQIVGIS